MGINFLAYPAVILVTFTSLMLLIHTDWRWIVLTLAVQYLGVFLLVFSVWPLELAALKIVAGWMASAILGFSIYEAVKAEPSVWQSTEKFSPSGRLFRLIAAGLVFIIIFSISPKLFEWINKIEVIQAVGASTLIGMGLLHLGLTAQPFRVIIGLLTFLSGFEILIAAVEVSALVAGLLTVVTLGLALIGGYLLLAPNMEEAP